MTLTHSLQSFWLQCHPPNVLSTVTIIFYMSSISPNFHFHSFTQALAWLGSAYHYQRACPSKKGAEWADDINLNLL
jgi:hypothetical protein